jgi:hypothetical protein
MGTVGPSRPSALFRMRAVCSALVVFASMDTARATSVHCSPPEGASLRLGAIAAQTRLEWIDSRLTQTGSRSRTWAWAWGGGIAVSGAASLLAVPFVHEQERVDWYAGAITAAIGVLPFVLAPPRVVHDSRQLHEKLARLPPEASPDDLCSMLANAEARLARDAEDQRQQQSWWLHVANLGFNVGVTLVLGLGYGHWSSGIINGGAGAVVGEAIILTQPTATIEDLRTYRMGNIEPLEPRRTTLLRYTTTF